MDAFHRIGNNSDEWLDIKRSVDAAYKSCMAKAGSYRHAGADITTTTDSNGNKMITVHQSYYIETIGDVDIAPERLRTNENLNGKDIEACRTALGALQWVVGCHSVSTLGLRSMQFAPHRASDPRDHGNGTGNASCGWQSTKLTFLKFLQVRHWTVLVVISMGEQAHANRPKGSSTGGLVTSVARHESLHGQVCEMTLLRTWKLRLEAIGSNDAEVQSILEAGDQNFRTRLIWSELKGGGATRRSSSTPRSRGDDGGPKKVHGVLCTDSRGGYPLFGVSNMRAALQAFQLRDNLQRAGCQLRWLASDYDLADALTKERLQSRWGLVKFLRTGLWSIRFDPSFTSTKKGKKLGKSAIEAIDSHLGDPNQASLKLFWGDAGTHTHA